MAKLRAAKEEIKEHVRAEMASSPAAIAVHYRGISNTDLISLRVTLRQTGASLRVMKNRIAIKSIDGGSLEHFVPLKKVLTGPTAIAYLRGDVAASAKALLGFEKEHENFQVTGGVLDGDFLATADIKAIADLPPKEVLLAKIVGSLVSPHRGILGVLGGVSTKLVRVLAAIRDNKAGS